MDNLRRRPPMEGFSRPGSLGGEAWNDEDSVEGHIMNDELKDKNVISRRSDDTEGHGFGLPRADEDTEGHGFGLPRADKEEDTEGHGYGLPRASEEDEDDTEGHRQLIR